MNTRNRILMLLLLAAGMSVRVLAENWQHRLPDRTYIANLSLPGSHDSATGSGFSGAMGLLGSRYAQTQELTIAEQFEQGIRVFDLRPCVYDDYMNINHGIMPTKLRFEDTMYEIRDLLKANPTEFVVIHMRHESEGDQVENAYNQRIVDFLQGDDIKDYLVNFKKTLMVKDVRGKILVLSRDTYASKPVGGFLKNWKFDNVNWDEQMQGQITGRTDSNTSPMTMQDYSDTHREGGVQVKVDAIRRMLDYSTTHFSRTNTGLRWYFNFLSAYSKVESFFGNEVSLSDGYRDNASHTNAAVLEYLAAADYKAGPMGVILMDYAGVDRSGNYETRGAELVKAIIENNFGYIDDVVLGVHTADGDNMPSNRIYDLAGRQVSKPAKGLYITGGKKLIR